MTQEPWLGLEEVLRKRRNRKRWQKVVTALCALVVFCTTYALILPAITLEKGCPIPEHTHTPECYTQVTARQETTLSCAAQLHQHTKGCYDQDHNLVCGYADFLVHTHEENCYDGSGNLRCPLREVKAHSHNENCYAPGHSHGEECYTRVQGPLICGKHVHTDDCWAETRELTCGLEEGPDHSHGEECYQVTRQLTCGEADHTHGEECYAWDQKLTCTQEETPVLTCREPEIILHRHTESCYDQEGNLVCGMMQILQHQHGEECFVTREIPVDTEALTCGDETHEHGPLCYGQWQLVCPLEEHTHDDRCTPGPEPEETEETEETEPTGETEETEATEPTGETETTEETEPTGETEPTEETDPTEETKATEPTEDSDAAKGGDQEAVKPTEAEETETPTQEPQTPEAPLPESTPSGLPVLGRAYAAVDPYGIMPLMLEDEEVLEDRDGVSGPVDVTQHIISDGTKLEYRVPPQNQDTDWKDTKDATNIPGNAEFKLTVQYEGVSITDLLNAGGKMTYTLPDIFRNAHDKGSIHDTNDNNKKIGDIIASGKTATITFDRKWLTDQQKNQNHVIGGHFYVRANADLTQINGGGDTTIQIGGVQLKVNFDSDLIAKYGDVTIKKEVKPKVYQDESGDYLEYTITVKAGQDGCPTVKVQDVFGTGKDWVEAYEATAGAGETITKDETGKTMTWAIGDMTAGETRTLTYKVKLKEGYTGGDSKGTISNEAKVFSKTHERKYDTANFTPRAEGTLSKLGSNVETLEDGSMKITYYIWVKALEENSYPLRDMIIRDALDGTGSMSNIITDSNIRPYISYDETSFKLYEGGNDQQQSMSGLTTEYTGSPENRLFFSDTDNDGKKNDSFEYHVGPLAPGKSRTLVYSVIIDPGAFTAAGNNAFQVQNRVDIYSVNSNSTKGNKLNAYYSIKEIARKAWTQKTAGETVATETSIQMAAPVYDGTTLSGITSFKVPKGSQQYQVIVNEAGDWDLSKATLEDTLSNPLVTFVGYVKLEAFKATTDSQGAFTAPDLNGTPEQTLWVNVNGQSSFSFTPEKLKLTDPYAYRLTYYAASTSPNPTPATNTFKLYGTVGYGNKTYTLSGITSSVGVEFSGNTYFHAEKQALFYEAATGSNGFLYWAIRVDGTALPVGFTIQDTPGSGNGLKGHSLPDGALVGVYTGPTELDLTKCETIGAVTNPMTALAADAYTSSVENGPLTVALKQEVTLEDRSLYVLVKTQPTELPTGKRDVFTYQNGFRYSFGENSWLDGPAASQTIYGKGSIFKELADVFTYDGKKDFNYIYSNTTNKKPRAGYDSSLLTPGEYVGWLIHLNHAGTLQGTYRVEETVPKGLEIAYIRMYWYGESLSGHPNAEMTPISGLGEGWKPKNNTSQGLTSNTPTNHYYVNGQTAKMDVTNLFPGHDTDNYAVELQIVCKLVDQDVLQGGLKKEFSNSVRLLTTDNVELDTDVSSVELSVPRIAKAAGDVENAPAGTYPFVITVNENGIDLMPEADTITLVDKLGERLTINSKSIRVTNTKTQELVTDWKSSVTSTDGKQTLRIVLPDNKALTITYTVSVNAPPGQTVTVSNNAYWEGYAQTGSSKVEDNTFQNKVGGSAGGTTTPKIQILKQDLYDMQKVLSGATFKLTKMELTGGQLIETNETQSKTTGDDGTLTFGDDTSLLDYDTVYKIVETHAPTGYVLDKTPHYVMVVRNGSSIKTDDYKNTGVEVNFWYATPTYTYPAYNHKGEITVNKQFTNADGVSIITPLEGTYRFGLFEQENPDAGTVPLAKAVAVYDQYGQPTETAKFTDVELGKAYYVYELDDNGNAILPGTARISNKIPFVVSYDKTQPINVTTGNPTASVTVTNRINYPELPQTGGVGTGVFRVSGAAAALLAGFILAGREGRKRKRRENNET